MTRQITYTNPCDNASFFNTPASTPLVTLEHTLGISEKLDKNIGALLTDQVSGGTDNYIKCNAARIYSADAAPASAPTPDTGTNASVTFDEFTWKVG